MRLNIKIETEIIIQMENLDDDIKQNKRWYNNKMFMKYHKHL